MTLTLELYGAKTGNCLRVAVALEEAGPALCRAATRLRRRGAPRDRGPRPQPTRQGAGARRARIRRGRARPHAVERDPALDRCRGARPAAAAGWRGARARDRALALPGHRRDRAEPRRLRAAPRRPTADAAAHHDRLAIDALAEAERFLGDGAFLAGDAFSLADIAGVTIAANHTGALDWPRLPRLHRWFDTIGARPAVRRGMAAFG